MPAESKIQILVADDQEIVRLGVRALLADTEIEVVAEAATGQAAVKLALEKTVDLVLLDVRMPDGDGLAALSGIKLDKPDLPVVLFSAFDNPGSVAKAIALGASGFLLKTCSRDELLDAIRNAAAGEDGWSATKHRGVGRCLTAPGIARSLEAYFTERENEVLQQMATGLSNNQIAVALNVSNETVKEYVQRILGKIGVRDRTQAAVWTVRNDLA